MPVIQMEEDVVQHMGGKLQPKADQRKYVSSWATKDKDLIGFPTQRDLQQPQPFGHGSSRALSGFEPHRIENKGGAKGSAEHIVYLNGVPLVEMVCDRESVEMRDRWTGTVSKDRIEKIKEEELSRLDRIGIKDPENMTERVVEDPEELSHK